MSRTIPAGTGLPRWSGAAGAPLLLAAVWVALIAPLRPEIASGTNLQYLLVSAAPLLLLTIGQLFVLLVGGIDLSASAVIGLASVLGASLMLRTSPAVGVLGMVAIGLAVGLLHGVCVARLRMPAFLVTLATAMSLAGASLWVTEAKPITDLPERFLWLTDAWIVGLPPSVWLAVLTAVLAHGVLTRSVFGKQLYAVGLNPATARVSGVPVAACVTAAFAVSGACAGLAAAVYTARLEVGLATLVPRETLLDVLGAAVLGGASLRGGRGTAPGIVVGVLVMALISNSLTLLDLAYWHVMMAKGGLIFLAATFDAWRLRAGDDA
jgi:ribose/xylose/arabinose/galactoside ABC-type transport system permease subunit